MLKKCKVVMLPTDKVATNGVQPFSNYSKPVTRGGLHMPNTGAQARREAMNGLQPYHLYVISNDTIKDGDVVFIKNLNTRILISENKAFKNASWLNEYSKAYKVIATTDTTLDLPGIRSSFVRVFCELNGIKEVNVKYQQCTCDTLYQNKNCTSILDLPDTDERNECVRENYPELDDKDRIIIRKVQSTFTRDELPFDLIKELIDINNDTLAVEIKNSSITNPSLKRANKLLTRLEGWYKNN